MGRPRMTDEQKAAAKAAREAASIPAMLLKPNATKWLEPAPLPPPELPPPGPQPISQLLPLPSLIQTLEGLKLPAVLCSVSHPAAEDGGLWVGKFSGVRLLRGEVAAQWSDGSTDLPPDLAGSQGARHE
jgi:hypothetical protein